MHATATVQLHLTTSTRCHINFIIRQLTKYELLKLSFVCNAKKLTNRNASSKASKWTQTLIHIHTHTHMHKYKHTNKNMRTQRQVTRLWVHINVCVCVWHSICTTGSIPLPTVCYTRDKRTRSASLPCCWHSTLHFVACNSRQLLAATYHLTCLRVRLSLVEWWFVCMCGWLPGRLHSLASFESVNDANNKNHNNNNSKYVRKPITRLSCVPPAVDLLSLSLPWLLCNFFKATDARVFTHERRMAGNIISTHQHTHTQAAEWLHLCAR